MGRLGSYRDVVYLVLLCALGLFALHTRVECQSGALQNARLPADVNGQLREELLAMNMRMRSLEGELQRNRLAADEAAHASRLRPAASAAELASPSAVAAVASAPELELAVRQRERAVHAALAEEAEEEFAADLDSDADVLASASAHSQHAAVDLRIPGDIVPDAVVEVSGEHDIAFDSESQLGEPSMEEQAQLDANEPMEEMNDASLENPEQADDGGEVDELAGVGSEDGDRDNLEEPAELGERLHDDDIESEELVDGDEDDEDDEDDEEEEIPTSPRAYGYVDNGDGKFTILNQVNPNAKKHFKMVGTKFLTLAHAWESAGWRHRYDASPVVALYLTKPITKVPGSVGKMISQVSKSSCIGGSKGAQLRCKVALADAHGCSYNDLRISPPQYNLLQRDDCLEYMRVAALPENARKQWIFKDGGAFHGRRMKFYEGLKSEVKKKYGKCTKNRKDAGLIMMEYVAQPVLFAGKKFDLRTYMLIASTKPFLVFYHEGFVRRSGTAYVNGTFSKLGHITNHKSQDKQAGHFWSFEQLENYLVDEQGFPAGYMVTEFRNYVKHITNYIFQAARFRLKRRSGAFMLFGLDWMIDQGRNVHFLEANGNPTIQNYEGTNLGPRIWNTMASLVTLVQREPETLNKGGDMTVIKGFKYAGWELVFNEAEELISGKSYNACQLPQYEECKDPDRCPVW